MIYNRYGAPVIFTAAEQRTVYIERLPGKITRHEDGPPKKPKGKIQPIHGCWFVKAVLAGKYPDGSGTIGEPMRHGCWVSENEFIADGGIVLISAECERIAALAEE